MVNDTAQREEMRSGNRDVASNVAVMHLDSQLVMGT